MYEFSIWSFGMMVGYAVMFAIFSWNIATEKKRTDEWRERAAELEGEVQHLTTVVACRDTDLDNKDDRDRRLVEAFAKWRQADIRKG